MPTIVARLCVGRSCFLLLLLGPGSQLGGQTVSQAVSSVFSGAHLYVNPVSAARQQAEAWRRSRPADAALMERIASQPLAEWVGGWNGNIGSYVSNAVARISGTNSLPVFVVYNIPGRDCGQFSSGGARGGDSYRRWVRDFANGLGRQRAVIILEPDALAGMTCLSPDRQRERLDLIHDAVRVLKQKGASVYIDAGNPGWVRADEMARRLNGAGIAEADGFALNIAHFYATSSNITYGTDVSRRVGGKHFIIDTSRNGQNATSAGNWCNPIGQRVGHVPATRTGHALVDAFLWVKTPGESDGSCGPAEAGTNPPPAGAWWPEYALMLVRNSGW